MFGSPIFITGSSFVPDVLGIGSFAVTIKEAVKSGDSENYEAPAAAYYWKKIFSCFLIR